MQAMQEAMQRPEVQQQVQEMSAAMANKEMQEKLEKLKVWMAMAASELRLLAIIWQHSHLFGLYFAG